MEEKFENVATKSKIKTKKGEKITGVI